MRSGQYEEIRLEQFRTNYTKAMKESGLPQYAIDNLNRLSIQDFGMLVNQRNPDRNTTNKYRMPQLGGFDYHVMTDVQARKDYVTNALEEISQLFKELNFDWKIPEKLKEGKPIKSRVKYSKRIVKVMRRFNTIYNNPINRPDNNMYDERSIQNLVERSVKTMRRTSKNLNQTVKRSKSGEYYIPFIGSTRKGTKNRNLLLDIVDLLNLDYEN